VVQSADFPESEPHLAQHTTGRRSAIDARTTRHPGYAISQQKRKLVEQGFGWMKTVRGLRKQRHRGGALVSWVFTFTAAAYNIGATAPPVAGHCVTRTTTGREPAPRSDVTAEPLCWTKTTSR